MAATTSTGVSRTQIEDKIKKFDSIITVAKNSEHADFKTVTYSYDDTACVQAALNAAVDGQTIMFLDGTYNINVAGGQLFQGGKSLNLVGYGNVVFNLTGGSADSGTIQFSGTQVLSTTLSSNVEIYSNTVTLLNVENVQIGDLLKIYSTDQWSPIEYPDLKTGEMYEIVGVNSSTKVVTLSQPLYRGYLSSNTTVKIYHPIQLNIKNIKFIGTGPTNSVNAITLLYVSHSKIENCGFVDNGKRSLRLSTCYDITVGNNVIRGSRYPAYGYGVEINNASAIITLTKNEISDCRHTIASGTGGVMSYGEAVGAFEGLNRCIKIDKNTLIGANMDDVGATIDSHPSTIDYLVDDNNIFPGLFTNSPYWAACAFGDGTQQSTFVNNRVYGGGGVMRRPGAPGSNTIIANNRLENTRGRNLYDGVRYDNHAGCPVNLTISNNQVKNALKTSSMTTDHGTGIELGTEDYKSITISENTIDGCTLYGIYLMQMSGVTLPMKLNIHNNIINNVGRDGIYLRRESASTVLDYEASGNIITDSNQSASTYRGIALIDVSKGRTECNEVINHTGTMDAAIKEVSILGSAVDYNVIKNNTHSGSTNGIVTVGTNSDSVDNKVV